MRVVFEFSDNRQKVILFLHDIAPQTNGNNDSSKPGKNTSYIF